MLSLRAPMRRFFSRANRTKDTRARFHFEFKTKLCNTILFVAFHIKLSFWLWRFPSQGAFSTNAKVLLYESDFRGTLSPLERAKVFAVPPLLVQTISLGDKVLLTVLINSTKSRWRRWADAISLPHADQQGDSTVWFVRFR